MRSLEVLSIHLLLWPVLLVSALRAADPADIEFFEKQVRPLLVEHCYECHAGTENSGGLLLDSRAGWQAGGDSGPVLVAGKPDESRLIEAIRYKNQDLQMPPQKPLAADQVAVLERWISRGAVDPRDAVPAATQPLRGMSLEDGRQFWSFLPITNPKMPKVADAAWVKTPIDAFVLARLEEAGLAPAPQADKATLLRRASLDLTGLPPTATEVDEFVADTSPDAFSKVIERLLASPHYGVRWGRHWLDVARYADSNGLDENLAFGQAWRYRDWVIQSFNRDLPFDRFVCEQVAGDLLPDQSTDSHIATGFLVLGAKVLAEPDRDKLMMDTIDEQLDTLGKAFLGMTFGCARCHDHKFDPISQADYYALAAIFKSTKTFGDTNTGAIKHWHEINLASPEEKEQLKAVDAAIAEKQRAAAAYKGQAMSAIREAARAQAVDYLVAALEIQPDTPLTEVAILAQPLGLHPRILHHCRRHLEFHADDPFFAKWHEVAQHRPVRVAQQASAHSASRLVSTSSLTPAEQPSEEQPREEPQREEPPSPHPVVAHYAPLFAQARQWSVAKQKDKQAAAASEQVRAAHDALFDTSGFLTVPAKVEFAFDAQTLAEFHRLADEARVIESFAPDMPSAMTVSENKTSPTLPIHIRGSHRNLGQPIERGFPPVMLGSSAQPIMPRHSSGRLELAQWLTSSTHPLTARVHVNRLWGWHFGQALVGSTENFGVLGDKPSHPELLDWLARTFIESGWSNKQLHRLIMNSSVYQMASLHTAPAMAEKVAELDADNRLLSRHQASRMDAEQIRDALLLVTGRLDQTLGGKSVPLRNRQFVFDHTSIDHTKYDSLRRAVYLPVIRNNLYVMFEQFDFPDPTMPTGHRHTTTVAPQALLMMNSDLVMESADQLAKELIDQASDTTDRVRLLVRRVLAREPTSVELEHIAMFIHSAGQSQLTIEQAWSLASQSLLMSNEFLMVR